MSVIPRQGLRRAVLPLDGGESARLYWELSQRGAGSWGEKQSWRYGSLADEELYTLAVLQSRYDPRLVEILVGFFYGPRVFDPVRFKEMLRRHEALPLAAAIGECVLQLAPDPSVVDLFRFLQSGVRPVPTQLFYLGLYRIGGRKMEEVCGRPLWPFKKWGFLAADPPFPKERIIARRTYLYDAPSRQTILLELAERMRRLRLCDYLGAVNRSISRQQALADIRSAPWLARQGKGKGTSYRYTR